MTRRAAADYLRGQVSRARTRTVELVGSASTVGEAIGREVIYKPIVIADFRRQLEQFGLPEGPGFEP
jgi:hypothetical protein